MSLSLSGKPGSINKLSGRLQPLSISVHIPSDIKNLKVRILDLFWLPLLYKKWNVIKQNLFLIDGFKKKIQIYYDSYKLEDLLLYRDVITLSEFFVQQQIQLEDMEKQIHKRSNNQVISMVYRTSMIKLKPEFELYNHILGRPVYEKQETYREDILAEIQKCILNENITYEKIHAHIVRRFS